MAYDPVPLGVMRWNKGSKTDPAQHALRDMLVTALHRLDSGEYKADHMILIIGNLHEDLSVSADMMQAGSFGNFAQLGLLTYASRGFLHAPDWE